MCVPRLELQREVEAELHELPGPEPVVPWSVVSWVD